MKQLILVRHGESEWNKLNLFTGWTDVDLTDFGREEAYKAGRLLRDEGFRPQICFTSFRLTIGLPVLLRHVLCRA